MPTGETVVASIISEGVRGVGEYFVHTSDEKEGMKMVNTLRNHVNEPVRYVPDIDYTIIGK